MRFHSGPLIGLTPPDWTIACDGEGYFCQVKKYTIPHTEESVAVKVLKREYRDNADYVYRFKREIDLLRVLAGHPNVIELIDSEMDEENKGYWYSTPVADYNLYNFIKKYNNRLELKQRLYIFKHILEALRYSHGKSVIHRDLAPTNVLVLFNLHDSSAPVIKVADFGLGKNLEGTSHFTHVATENYGQYLYVAPEQRESLSQATDKSDIYSLGKLLYFVLTGKDPERCN